MSELSNRLILTEEQKDIINTLDISTSELIEEIKILIGSPYVKLKVNDWDIYTMIRKAIKTINSNIGEIELIEKDNTGSIDLKEEKVIEVLSVYNAIVTDTSRLPDYSNISFGSGSRKKSLIFKYSGGILTLSPEFSSRVVVEAIVEKEFKDIKDSAIRSWVSDYSLALVQEIEARRRSRFVMNNVAVEQDTSAMLDSAKEAQNNLIEKLNEKYTGQIFMTR